MRKVFFGGVVAFGLAFSAAYAALYTPFGGTVVSSPLSAYELTTDSNYFVVDIREPVEWERTGVLEAANLHSWRGVEAFESAFGDELEAGQKVVLIGASGERSKDAAAQLSRFRGEDVIDVSGGVERLMMSGADLSAPDA